MKLFDVYTYWWLRVLERDHCHPLYPRVQKTIPYRVVHNRDLTHVRALHHSPCVALRPLECHSTTTTGVTVRPFRVKLRSPGQTYHNQMTARMATANVRTCYRTYRECPSADPAAMYVDCMC